MNHIETSNLAVLDALGIPHKDLLIESVSLNLIAGNLPVVHITRYLDRDVITTATRRFQLVALDDEEPPTPAFDLDAMVEAARQRLEKFINAEAAHAHLHVARSFAAQKLRISVRCETSKLVRGLSEVMGMGIGIGGMLGAGTIAGTGGAA